MSQTQIEMDRDHAIIRHLKAQPTLRDNLAMAALPAVIALWEVERNDPQTMAARAYEMADAMLWARSRGQ